MRHKSLPPAQERRPVLVEVCVQTPASAEAAQRAGADRIELCAALEVGGVTPGAGLLRAVRARVGLPLHVLVRPRSGDFVYAPAELEAMLGDIAEARRAGADGVVLGVLAPDGTVARESCARLVEAAGPLAVTFHRAFDATRDSGEALETLADVGVGRVLTSGGAPTAAQGASALSRLVQAAGQRLTILAAGTIRADGVTGLVEATGLRELHLGPCRGPQGDLDEDALRAVLRALASRGHRAA